MFTSSGNTPGSAAPRKTLIFHIGDHKTGSTSVQNALANGLITLSGQEILYPGRLNHNYLSKHLSHLSKRGKDLPSRPGMPSLTKITEQIAASDARYVVLSGESFEGCNQDDFHRMVMTRFAPLVDDLRIIAYVRPHPSRILSTFAEQTKIGWFQGNLQGYHKKTLAAQRFHYAPRLQKWRQLFGDSFIVRPMLRDLLVNRSVIDDFAATAFVGEDWRSRPAAANNPSLDLHDLMMVKYMQSHFQSLQKGTRLGIGWDLVANVAEAPPRPDTEKLQLHKALAANIRSAYLDDARRIDAEFFGAQGRFEQALEQAVETARPKAQSCNPKDYFSDQELRALSIQAKSLCALLHKKDAQWGAFFRNRRARVVEGNGDGAGKRTTAGANSSTRKGKAERVIGKLGGKLGKARRKKAAQSSPQ